MRRKKKNNMAASTLVTAADQNASLVIDEVDEILTQVEEQDILRMLDEEKEVNQCKGEEQTTKKALGEGDEREASPETQPESDRNPLGIFGCFDIRVTSDSDVGSWLDFG